MISLAPMRYARVLSKYGGPVQRLEYSQSEVLGEDCIRAAAYLREDLVSESEKPKICRGQPEGAGSHKSAQIACHMAVSEALCRWAVFHCLAHPETQRSVMQYDQSPIGFAAYPGLFRKQARKLAFRESIERHCLICWWEGMLSYHPLLDPLPGVRAIEIENPFSSHRVVFFWGRRCGRHTFAFGSGNTLKHAIWRTYFEFQRTENLLNRIAKSKLSVPRRPIDNPFEQRIDYFSSDEGFSHFLSFLERPVRRKPAPLKLLYDAEVVGPWSKYATVWRTVIEAPSCDYLSDTGEYLYW